MAIEDEEASTNNPTTTTAKTISKFTIVVQAQDNSSTRFRVAPKLRFSKIANAYAENKRLDVKSLRFHHDGIRIEEGKSMAELELVPEEDDDEVMIDVFMDQIGGGDGI